MKKKTRQTKEIATKVGQAAKKVEQAAGYMKTAKVRNLDAAGRLVQKAAICQI